LNEEAYCVGSGVEAGGFKVGSLQVGVASSGSGSGCLLLGSRAQREVVNDSLGSGSRSHKGVVERMPVAWPALVKEEVDE
jgi:hypothetical protein